jgi:hypothetical protein
LKLVRLINTNILKNNIIFRIFDLDYFYLDLEKFYSKSNIVTILKKIERYTLFVVELTTILLLLKKRRLETIYLYNFKKTYCTNN